MKNNILIKVDNQVVGTVPVVNILEPHYTKNDTDCMTRVRFDKQRVAEAFNKSLCVKYTK
jgi:hypothetical protein